MEGDNSEIQNAVFSKRKTSWNSYRNLKNDLFLGHIQPLKDKNSKHLAVLILEFDDVTVKTIYKCNFYHSFSATIDKKASFGFSVIQKLLGNDLLISQ